MNYEIRPFQEGMEKDWDPWCEGAVNATLLHTRRFLSYHGSRFQDRSVVILRDGAWAGVFPAALDPSDPGRVVSHPGATYGGVVHQGELTGGRMQEALAALADFYRTQGSRALLYKKVPSIHTLACAQDDSYALFRAGARRVRCDLSCAIDLQARLPVSERRKRGLKKAEKAVRLSADTALLGDLWEVIAGNLAQKYGAHPVHSKEELIKLAGLFPDRILSRAALLGDRVVAGVVLFNSPRAWHAQYIAAGPEGYEVNALDLVFEDAIREAGRTGARYFDFGTSNGTAGMELNETLFRFKAEFGGSGAVHESFEMGL